MRRVLLLTACLLLCGAPGAYAASIAYLDDGEVWVSSLDAARKARLATPVVNADGKTERWLAVTASDSGRIVASRNDPSKISRLSWFKAWEADGSSFVEGPLTSPPGWATYLYPLGFDLTANGLNMVYGYSNAGGCCPIPFDQGTYVKPVVNSPLDPIVRSGPEDPTVFGSRIVAHEGSIIKVQEAGTGPFGPNFVPWIDASGTGLEVRRTDVAANGRLAALELEEWSGGAQTVGKIAVIATDGVDKTPTFAVDCFLPATGIAKDVSLSQDASRIAWTDAEGLKVAGAPTSSADPCELTAPPVIISPTGKEGAIGGADVAAFLPAPAPASGGSPPGGAPGPAPPQAPPPGPSTPPRAPAGATAGPGGAAPVATLPQRVTVAGLAARTGLAVRVRAARAGRVRISGTVPARVLRRRGRPIVVATGSASVSRAGVVTVRLKLTPAARRQRNRLKGARLTLRISLGDVSSVVRTTLR